MKKKHPLLVGLKTVMAREGMSARRVAAKHLGVTQQALHGWITAARQGKPGIPPHRVPKFSKLTGIPPHAFDKVLWPDPNWKFK